MSELFKIPQEKYLFSFFMFTNDHNFCLSLNIYHEIETKLKVSGAKRELFISLNSELVCSIDIIVDFFKKLKESKKGIFGEIVFHVLNETFNIFGFISITIQFISKEFTKLIFIDSRS